MTPISKDAGFEHPDDGFYMIEPAGEHPDREGRVVQVIDSPAIASIVENFNAGAQAANFSGLLIDHEHFKHDLEKETIAYGWLMGLQAREDGIYGRIRWTATGQKAVDGGDYRFFSTEYDPEDLEVLSDGPPMRARPLKLDGLTLTNAPNNKGASPITNRSATEPIAPATPEGAGRAFSVIVNRKRAALNCSFDQAWKLASKENPALFAAMGGQQCRPAGGEAEATGRVLSRIVNRIQREHNCSFDRAWNCARQQHPTLFDCK